MIDGGPATTSTTTGRATGARPTGEQDNSWTVQVVTTCDIGIDGEPYYTFDVDGVEHSVYRWTEDQAVQLEGLDGTCLHRGTFEVIISNLPSGDLSFLDADYELRVTNRGKAGRRP